MSSFDRQAAGYTKTGEAYHVRHPVDDLEPREFGSNDVRDARLRFLEVIADWAALMHRAFSGDNPTVDSVIPSVYGPMFSIGLSCLSGLGMSDIADRFNISRASISKVSIQFAEAHDLPPSPYQKEIEARASYSRSRIAQVQSSSDEALPPHQKAARFKPMPELPK